MTVCDDKDKQEELDSHRTAMRGRQRSTDLSVLLILFHPCLFLNLITCFLFGHKSTHTNAFGVSLTTTLKERKYLDFWMVFYQSPESSAPPRKA